MSPVPYIAIELMFAIINAVLFIEQPNPYSAAAFVVCIAAAVLIGVT